MDRIIQALGGSTLGNRLKRPFLPPQASVRRTLLFITTILLAATHQQLHAQDVTPSAPPPSVTQNAQVPDLSGIPHATPLPPTTPPMRAVLESDTQTKHDSLYTAHGDVVLTYGDHVLSADDVIYNEDTGDVEATGHVHLTGGENHESIEATHGTYNLGTQTGRFYDVNGSVGVPNQASTAAPVMAAPNASSFGIANPRLPGYQTDNPFLFEGRIVVKTGPRRLHGLRRLRHLLPAAASGLAALCAQDHAHQRYRPRSQLHLQAARHPAALSALRHAPRGQQHPPVRPADPGLRLLQRQQ